MVKMDNFARALWMLFPVIWPVMALLSGQISARDNVQASGKAGTEEVSFVEERVCDGTNFRLSTNQNHTHHLRNMRSRYENCTYVQGNLEIVNIWEHDDLSYLSQIREVSGYVTISQIGRSIVPLPNLRVIRGQTLFDTDGRKHSLWVTLNPGLRVIDFSSLQEIMRGNVLFHENPKLCHVDETVDWYDILADNGTQTMEIENTFYVPGLRECRPCSQVCSGFCWGSSPHQCQQRSKSICANQCQPGRCYGKGARECCSAECLAGCRGPGANECLACRSFDNEGVCVRDCPADRYYDPETMKWIRKPDPKMAYGNTCVTQCPDNMLRDDGACVRECPDGKFAQNSTCAVCDGPCPKVCRGFRISEVDRVHGINFITNITLETFVNCTVIEGDLLILSQTFTGVMEFHSTGHAQQLHDAVTPAQLEQLSTIREINGYLRVDGSHPDMTSLSFLRNLKAIYGRTLDEKFAITVTKSKYLTSLGLDSLQQVVGGGVRVLENKQLCFSDTVNWPKITLPKVPILVQNNRRNQTCQAEGQTCHPECSPDGCWGKNSTQCLTCANFKFGKTCIESCQHQAELLFDSGNKVCKACHSQCQAGCDGLGPENCTSCLNVKDDLVCKPACPVSKYKDNTGTCQPCNAVCSAQGDELKQGCTGNGTFVGDGGCRSCDVGLYNKNGTVATVECIPSSEKCPSRHYMQHPGVPEARVLGMEAMAGKTLCRPCHPLCKKCQGEGIHCDECLYFKEDGKCVSNCTFGTHFRKSRFCRPCSSECSPKWGCAGPHATDCVKCKNSRDYYDVALDGKLQSNAYNCTTTCPAERPFTTREGHSDTLDSTESVCTVVDDAKREEEALKRKRITLGCAIGLGIPIVGLIIYACLSIHKSKVDKKTAKLIDDFKVVAEPEPFTPTDIKPNTSKLRVFSEKELRRGQLLGQGAFGFVYRGMLVPAHENKKIPVAIKVLKEGLSVAANQEVLEEARVMASVHNNFLVPLIGICMTAPPILVTQFLPLGCLLDYVKMNKTNISSTNFLNWCLQIARGLKYLEDRHMLHRDLAARNVLVQTPTWVKVTDFGLAKMLDVNESTYKAGNGRMPVKWLAPECIEKNIYSHKTDVWAYGVTVWEIFTYGEKPYDNIPARDLWEKLQSGERLPHPGICSLDVYMLMLKCWSPHPESRPAFGELASEFGKMARDPGRYLTIVGDDQLRLPDFTKEDEQRIYGQDTCGQGDEEFLTADQYINPGAYSFEPSLGDTLKKSKYQNGHIKNGCGPDSWQQQHSSLPVFTNVSAPINESRGAWSVDRKDSPPHSRYAMDPVKGVGKYGETVQAATKRKASGGAVLVGPDDYLVPTDGSPTSDGPYLDLTDQFLKERDAVLLEDLQKMPLLSGKDGRRASSTPKAYPPLRGTPGGTGRGAIATAPLVNNPEYHLFSSGASTASTESAPSQTASISSTVPLAPDDDDSDREYYQNLRERTRGEMIPLNQRPMRDETTV